ncbi:RHS repeat-associated core domain-containing protein [Sorangium cellulosum]|uniref:RHS repeat-associated core domain-containing protein n=1 Tax=Sorangium cellulosum TaxID=56 RepID=UPI000CF4109D|nr:RHS repeat-associated core domain-containing protein [Sorangium cellulosum]
MLAACGGNAPEDDVTNSEEELTSPALSAGASPSDVSALAPRPGLDVTVSPERGELLASLAFPTLPSRASSGAALALSYGSVPADLSQGFGVGFSLSVPSIEMTTDWGVPYRGREADTQDVTARLSLGAERLIWVKKETVSGKTRIEYRLDASASTVRLYRYPQGGTVTMRDASGALQSVAFTGFEVVYPDGRREIYSEDASVAEGVAVTSGFFPTRWPLLHVISPTGDAVSYEYTKAGERSYLRSVRFAGGRSVYSLESVPRSEGRVSHLMGYPQGPGQLTTKLTASFDGEPMYTWCFVHAVHGESGPEIVTHSDCQALASEDFEADRQRVAAALSRESKLLGVYRFGRGQVPFDRSALAEPLIRFRYTAWGADDITGHELVYDMDVPDVFGFGPSGGSELMDINSDGLADIVRYSAREGTSVPAYNGGDLAEASLFTTSGAPLTVERTIGGVSRSDVPRFDAAAQATSVFLSGDFDGDGRTDLVQATASGTRTELAHYAGRADRARPFAAAASSTVVEVELSRFARGRTQAVDLNADGKADLLTTVAGSTDSTWTAFINVTQPGASALSFKPLVGLTFPYRQGAGTELDNPAYRFLDANGDGLTDFAVIRSSGAGEKGICVYENQGKVTAYSVGSTSVAKLQAGSLLFGDPSANDPVCAQGRFVSVPGLSSSQNINAMWLIDVNGDSDMDLVNVTAAANELGVWLGQGEEGFAAERRVPLDEGVSVDPENKWNTQVLDIDADGAEEILVYERNAGGGRIKVIDFNRDGVKNRIGPDLLSEVEEGPGLKHAVQYATSTDERIRDARRFGRDDARARALPYPVTLVKRHLTAVGDEAPRAREFQYHAPYFNERERNFAGFGQCEELDVGDDSSASVVRRRVYQVALAAAPVRRFFAGKLRTEEIFEPRLIGAQAARIAARAGKWPSGIEGASQTAETWSEEPYEVAALLGVREETWALVPPAPGPKTPAFLRQASTRDVQCSGTGCAPACATGPCAEAATVTQTLTYDTAYNRLVRREQSLSAVAGPNGTEVPARSYVGTYAYDAGWEARGVLTAVREETLLAGPSGRVLQRTSYEYGSDVPLPVRVTQPLLVDAEALAGLPAAVSAPLLAPRTQVQTYRYDAFGNVVQTSDALGLRGTNVYDTTGVLLVETRNALGHATQYCYGTAGCALTVLAPRAEGVVPARSFLPTHLRTPQGDVELTEYDARHRPVRTARSSGAESRYAYRDAGAAAPALVRITERRAAEEVESALIERLAAFRADGLSLGQAVEHEAGGARVVAFDRYGRRGQPVFEALPYSSEVGIGAAFDAGRFPSPDATARGTTNAYDALGRVVTRIDAAGLVTRIAVEPWGQRVEEERGGGAARVETRLTVGRGGEVFAIVDELNQVHRYERDERGSLRAVALAGTGTPRRMAYDSAGNLVMMSLSGGLTRLWARDARGRATEVRTWDRAFAAWESVEMAYDAQNRPTDVFASSSSRPEGWDDRSFVYDAREGEDQRPELIGHLVEVTTSDRVSGQRVQESFTYELDGRISGRQIALDAGDTRRDYEERWTYGLDGTVASYRDPFGNMLSFTRTPWGALSSIAWSAGGRAAAPLMTEIGYDRRGQLASYRVPSTGLHRELGYDPSSGLLTHLKACVGDGADPCALGPLQDVAYDRRADGRVIAARASTPRAAASDTASYTYSARGELLGAVMAGVTHTYTYTPAGKVASFGEGAQAQPFLDEEGSDALPLPEEGNGQRDSFGRLSAFERFRNAEYDPWGRLRRVEVDGGVLVYGYDAAGERLSKRLLRREGDREVPASLVVYPTRTTRDDGVERQSLFRLGGHRAVLLVNEARVLSLIDDQHWVVQRVVDERGETVLSADTTPFGSLARDAQTSATELASTELVLGFTGQLRDPDTGLVHMGARDYVPALASFATPDPYALGEPELCARSLLDCHPYAYADHDPVNFTDESGLMPLFTQRSSRRQQRHQQRQTERIRQWADESIGPPSRLRNVQELPQRPGPVYTTESPAPPGQTQLFEEMDRLRIANRSLAAFMDNRNQSRHVHFQWGINSAGHVLIQRSRNSGNPATPSGLATEQRIGGRFDRQNDQNYRYVMSNNSHFSRAATRADGIGVGIIPLGNAYAVLRELGADMTGIEVQDVVTDREATPPMYETPTPPEYPPPPAY